MDPAVLVFPFVFGFPVMGWIVLMTYRHRERMAELKGSGTGDPDTQARLERLEQSVDAIAVEIERIGEGQRFVTRLLSERAIAPGEARASGADAGR